MNKINIFNECNYPINEREIKKIINNTLKSQRVKQDTEVNISFIDNKNMAVLHKKYLHENGTTDVLSFPIDELKSIKSSKIKFKNPDNITRLGDIVISFPQAEKQAKESSTTVIAEINKLIEHGLLHVLGIHHE